ncbi:MAG TPA: type III pantothenate kinase [Bacillota bacterium]|nr:type III pantothenate kinase [Bacillota bacterium]
MIFVLDAGNTHTVLGVFEEGTLRNEWRIRTDRRKTEDELGVLVKSLFDLKGISFSDINGLIISSVVPPLIEILEKMSMDYFDLKPLIIGRKEVDPHLAMNYPYPREVGADRIVNAVGAIKKYGSPVIIVDFGTATTYCYVNEKEEYSGGLITPGITISMDALFSRASKLPKIGIRKPDRVIGKSTVGAMQSGLFYGYVGQVDGIIRKMKEETEQAIKVIATGGLASLIADASEMIDYVDHHLTLEGLYEIYMRNMKDKS